MLAPAWTASLDGPLSTETTLVASGAGLVHVADTQAVYGLAAADGERRWKTAVSLATGSRLSNLIATTDEVSIAHLDLGATPNRRLVRLAADSGTVLGTTGLTTATLTAASGGHHDSTATVRSGDWVALTGYDVSPPVGRLPFFWGSQLAAANLADPARSWQGGFGTLGDPIVVGNRIYAVSLASSSVGPGGRHNLLAWTLDSPCGSACLPVLNVPLPALGEGASWAPAASADGSTVYVVSGGVLTAVDVATGAVAWSAGTPSASGGIRGVPTVTPDGVVVTGDEVELFPLHGCGSATCAPTWSSGPIAGLRARTAAANGLVFAGTEDGSVLALPTTCSAACAPTWSQDAGSSLRAGPIVNQGKVLVATADGRVVAYGPG